MPHLPNQPWNDTKMAVGAPCDVNFGFVFKESGDHLPKPSCARYYPETLKLNSYGRSLTLYWSTRKILYRGYNQRPERKQPHRQIFCKNHAESAEAYGDEKEEEVSRAILIWRAIKLPIYSVALIPLTVGGAAAYLEKGIFSARRYFILLASSILIITWLNLSNDVYDLDTGADKNKKESVVNLVRSRTGTLISALSSLVLGLLGLTWTSINSGNLQSILLLASAIFCGYIYQCPPFRLSYQGLGEPLCFAAFGPFATTGFYLLLGSSSQMSHLPLTCKILSASFLVGFTTSLILFCSHFHQVEEDLAVGKMSPLVRLGTERGSVIVRMAVVALYVLLLALGLTGSLPLTCLFFCGLTLPMGNSVVSYVEKNRNDKAKIFMAKYFCVRLHTLFGAALSAGLVAARLTTAIPTRKYAQSLVISWP